MKKTSRYRLSVGSRALAAIVANYALTAILVSLFARALPMARQEATVAAMLLSFPLFAVNALAIFHARSIKRMWLWMMGLILLFGALLWLSLHFGGRL